MTDPQNTDEEPDISRADHLGSRPQARIIVQEDGIPVDMLFREEVTPEDVDSADQSRTENRISDLKLANPAGIPIVTSPELSTQRSAVETPVTAKSSWNVTPPSTGAVRAPRRRTASRPPVRHAIRADPALVERKGAAVSGWLALFIGALSLACGAWLLWLTGTIPGDWLTRIGLSPHQRAHTMRPWEWVIVGAWGAIAIIAFGGLTRGRAGSAWVLSVFGRYRGTVRRTGLVWINPFLLRRRADVRLRHWRSEPMQAVDAQGASLRVIVLVVWQIKDTARATFAVEDHLAYLREQVEAAMARVLSQLPTDAFQGDSPTLRNAEAVGGSLTAMLSADCLPVGIEIFSAQPTRIEYAPEVAAAMQRRQVAALDAKYRDSVLTSVVDAVDDTVTRLTTRGLVELDDYERKALIKDLTVAFYTGRSTATERL
ncbi:SPFH domain-containing protein [Streptomyces sp. N35]|uniref:SPFH domain-containing protein n=1 Tax=Streptomyces sp. N35 TaxID=2795730 RepID=UPI001F3E3796|nr:SPFH domain-containing protein [Streptomyces sp. N35]